MPALLPDCLTLPLQLQCAAARAPHSPVQMSPTSLNQLYINVFVVSQPRQGLDRDNEKRGIIVDERPKKKEGIIITAEWERCLSENVEWIVHPILMHHYSSSRGSTQKQRHPFLRFSGLFVSLAIKHQRIKMFLLNGVDDTRTENEWIYLKRTIKDLKNPLWAFESPLPAFLWYPWHSARGDPTYIHCWGLNVTFHSGRGCLQFGSWLVSVCVNAVTDRLPEVC